MMNKASWTALGLMIAVAWACTACEGEPDTSDRSPLYRWGAENEPSSGERGNLLITEINFAGSVADDGTRDADDVFIELQNKHPRAINPSGWHLEVRGDVNRTWRLPPVEDPIMPNDYFVVARKADGAFGDITRESGVFIEDLELGSRRVSVELRDFDLRLMEQVGSRDDEVFVGGWDTVTVRTMERAELIFGNQGGDARNWHAYSDTVGFSTINEGWRKYTLASPGAANSADYSGSSTSGNFE